jgi:predicted Rossmann-fold nucleotide-binding protein
MDELYEALNLMQNGKLNHFPVILFGSRYWKGLIAWMRETLLATEKISAADMDAFCLSDDPEEVCRLVLEAYQERRRHETYDQSIR